MPHARFPDMEALIAALRDDPTVRRRRRWRQAVVAVLVGGGAAASIAYAQKPPVCTHARAKFDAVWSPDARASASAAFAGSERAHAGHAWRRTELELDTYAGQWVEAHTEACEATAVRGEQSEDMLDRRMSCLDQRLREVEAVVTLFVAADAGVVDHAAKVLGQLEDVEECNDTSALLDALPPPAMAERAEADDIRMQLARAKVLRTAGRYREAAEVIEAVEHRVHALDYAPLSAEFLYMKAAAEVDAGRPAAGEEQFYAAALVAAEAGHKALEPTIWIALVRVVGTHEDRPLQLPPLVKAAEVAVARAGSPVGDRGALALIVGTQALVRSEYSAAEPRLQEAVALLGEARGVDHPDTLEAREMLALTYHGRKRFDEAEAALVGIAEAIERTQGPTHPSLASVLANLSRIHAARGELQLARETGERALAAIIQAFGRSHQAVATGHANLATTLRKLGRYDEAVEHLDAALAIEKELFGAESPRIASTVHGRAQVSFVRGMPQAAVADYREALRIWERTLGPDDPRNAYALTGIGKSELELGRAESAIAALERALVCARPRRTWAPTIWPRRASSSPRHCGPQGATTCGRASSPVRPARCSCSSQPMTTCVPSMRGSPRHREAIVIRSE